MARVVQIKTQEESCTQYVTHLEDLKDIIINYLGEDTWEAIQYFVAEKAEKQVEEGPNIITFIEDGIFSEQIEESGLIGEMVDAIVDGLIEQDFIKKNKSINKFSYETEYYRNLIDEKLSPGMMRYFEED